MNNNTISTEFINPTGEINQDTQNKRGEMVINNEQGEEIHRLAITYLDTTSPDTLARDIEELFSSSKTYIESYDAWKSYIDNSNQSEEISRRELTHEVLHEPLSAQDSIKTEDESLHAPSTNTEAGGRSQLFQYVIRTINKVFSAIFAPLPRSMNTLNENRDGIRGRQNGASVRAPSLAGYRIPEHKVDNKQERVPPFAKHEDLERLKHQAQERLELIFEDDDLFESHAAVEESKGYKRLNISHPPEDLHSFNLGELSDSIEDAEG